MSIKITIELGVIKNAPIFSDTKDGTKQAKFSVSKKLTRKDKTEYRSYQCYAYGRSAEKLEQEYLGKPQKDITVILNGRIAETQKNKAEVTYKNGQTYATNFFYDTLTVDSIFVINSEPRQHNDYIESNSNGADYIQSMQDNDIPF